MNRITSFVKRLPFLEVHPVIVAGIVLFPIVITGLHSYAFVNQDEMSKDLIESIRENQSILQSIHEESEKKLQMRMDEYDKVMRPIKYA